MFHDIYPDVERSTLFNIEPIGIGTPFVESLTGYLSRLSVHHSLKTGDLVAKIITPLINNPYLTNIAKKGGDGFYKSSHGINGLGTLAQDFMDVLGKLTSRKDLKATTLLRWSEILSTRGLLRSERAWCPICYTQDLEEDKNIYERLIWNFRISNICTIHNQQLTNICPSCHQSNLVLTRKSMPGYCNKCDNWLGDKHYEQNDLVLEENIQIANILANMLTDSDIDEKLNRSLISEALNYYISKCFSGESSQMCKALNIPKSTLSCWLNGDSLPQVSSLLKICVHLGITVSEFLIKSEVKLDKISPANQKDKSIQERKRHDHQKIEKFINEVIRERIPYSIKGVAELIGCDRKLLYRNYP